MTKVSDTKYRDMADNVVRLHEESGVKMIDNYEDWGINTCYPSDSGIEFVFYWNSIDSIKTEDGSISFGSMSGSGSSFLVAEKNMKEYFGLEKVFERDGMTGEKWFYYRPTKNVPE